MMATKMPKGIKIEAKYKESFAAWHCASKQAGGDTKANLSRDEQKSRTGTTSVEKATKGTILLLLLPIDFLNLNLHVKSCKNPLGFGCSRKLSTATAITGMGTKNFLSDSGLITTEQN